MAVDIKTIEDLLVDRIRDQLPYLFKVDSYESKFGVELDELIIDAPAVLCSLESTSRKEPWEAFNTMCVEHRFAMGIISRDMRGPDDARRTIAGAYQIMNDLRTALQSYQLSSSLSPLEFGGETFITASPVGVIYRAIYTVCEVED